ncbi:hypothetical protein QYM36_001502 [Artemia franciscana]|uniref:U2A'/phosphoprotein 32 family A C-terminal domain-containing protein n=1 Tax=Artemia franciscana TaxID=6661 RepID=A0AA88LFS3_ARTSF|nr:hypothetical protein QYM36_001502 [Artemia franciscana]
MDSSLYNCIVGKAGEASLTELKELSLVNQRFSTVDGIGDIRKLKHLKRVNLTLNLLGSIEKLGSLEELEIADFSCNNIASVSEVCEELKECLKLNDLTLLGNPCTRSPNYRNYVIASLPQLLRLDHVEITRLDKIQATADLENYTKEFETFQKTQNMDNNEPERKKSQETPRNWPNPPDFRFHRPRTLEIRGKMLNVNEGNFIYDVKECENFYEMELSVPKFVYSDDIGVDVQKTYVRVDVKGNVFQLVFNENIDSQNSKAQRSLATGKLYIRMPKLK